MPNANISTEVLEQPKPFTSSDAGLPLSKSFRITAGGAKNLRMDLYTSVADGGTITLQHSSGYQVWTTAKTSGTLPTEAGTTATANDSTDEVTATSHGLVDNEPFSLSSTAEVPAPLKADTVYYAQLVDANTIKVRNEPSGPSINLTSAGSGTITLAPISVTSIQLNVEVAGDQGVMPLKSEGRLIVGTASGSTTRIVSAKLMVEN